MLNTTTFTSRAGTYNFPKPTPTNGWTSLVNNWHKGVFEQMDVEYRLEKSGPGNNVTWTATPRIMGEEHPQYAGTGSTISEAKANSAKQIAESDHC